MANSPAPLTARLPVPIAEVCHGRFTIAIIYEPFRGRQPRGAAYAGCACARSDWSTTQPGYATRSHGNEADSLT